MALRLLHRKIPQLPGVYFFKDNRGKTLYIGKATNLRARLRFYFAENQTSLKVKTLISESKTLDWETLGSETEALIREAELIKKHLPKYNVLMRDDKQYFYVGFSKEKFPKIFITHQPISPKPSLGHALNSVWDKVDYIGPFTEGGVLRSVLKTLRRAFPYCTCRKPHKWPCLNAKIGRCIGYCCNQIQNSKFKIQNYRQNISSIKTILSGRNRGLTRELKKEMRELSAAQKYEDAGKVRDQIRALEKIFAHRGVIKQDLLTEISKALQTLESILNISDINRIEAYDIANIQGKFAYGSMAVFADGKIQKNDYRIFKIKSVRGSNDPAMLREVIFRRLRHKEWPYPEVIIVDGGRAQLSVALAVKPPSKIIALTKNKKHAGDHIFIGGKALPIPISRLPEPLKNFILMLDSEAHRFAISHYRKLHKKEMLI